MDGEADDLMEIWGEEVNYVSRKSEQWTRLVAVLLCIYSNNSYKEPALARPQLWMLSLPLLTLLL